MNRAVMESRAAWAGSGGTQHSGEVLLQLRGSRQHAFPTVSAPPTRHNTRQGAQNTRPTALRLWTNALSTGEPCKTDHATRSTDPMQKHLVGRRAARRSQRPPANVEAALPPKFARVHTVARVHRPAPRTVRGERVFGHSPRRGSPTRPLEHSRSIVERSSHVETSMSARKL